MAVAAERGPERRGALAHRAALGRLQAAEVHGDLAGERLPDHPLGDLADAGEGAKAVAPPGGQTRQLLRVDAVDARTL
jgi:hypothetical protein